MIWSAEREVIIDPFVLALVWSEIAPRELRGLRKEEDERRPTKTEEDQYIGDTSAAIFGEDSSRYPLDFLKGTLLFTTRIRTLFSGSKFTSFRNMLHDSVRPKHHKQLKHLHPLFDDPEYARLRLGAYSRTRPWDLALRGINPADLGMGSEDHFLPMSTANTLGQCVERIIRFLNEDESADFLIEEVNELSWPDGEPIDLSLGFHQFVVDYLALYQFSFDRPLFSFNDVSPWIVARTRKTNSEIDARRQVEHAITVTMPEFSKLSLDDVFELRNERFIKCYREIVEAGGLQTLTRSDVDRMIRAEMLAATDRSAFGAKELAIDLTKFILSLIPASGMLVEGAKAAVEHADTAIDVSVETGSVRSRFRRFRNRWLWFVMNARGKAGDLFKTLSQETPQR
jgi:hypothetical protein